MATKNIVFEMVTIKTIVQSANFLLQLLSKTNPLKINIQICQFSRHAFSLVPPLSRPTNQNNATMLIKNKTLTANLFVDFRFTVCVLLFVSSGPSEQKRMCEICAFLNANALQQYRHGQKFLPSGAINTSGMSDVSVVKTAGRLFRVCGFSSACSSRKKVVE